MSETALTDGSASEEGGEDYSYLSLLTRAKKALETAREVAISVTDIRPYPQQPREHFSETALDRLAYSIDNGGQTTSGMIREKPAATRYELIDGERRWRAIRRIPEERRPLFRARLIEADDDVVQYLISGIANFNREGHTPLETMKTITRLIKYLPMKEIAGLLGISEMWANNMYGLRKLDPKVLTLLDPTLSKEKRLPVTAAIAISKMDRQLQLELAERVMSKDVPLKRLRGEVVKVSMRAGLPVRVRVPEVTPLDQWNSLTKKVELLAQTTEDILLLLKVKEMHAFLGYRLNETRALQAKLEKVRRSVVQAEEEIHKVKKK